MYSALQYRNRIEGTKMNEEEGITRFVALIEWLSPATSLLAPSWSAKKNYRPFPPLRNSIH